METLDIGICSDVAHPFTHGGAEKRYALMMRELRARGHDVTMYTLKWWDAPHFELDGVRYVATTAPRRMYANASRRSMWQPALFAIAAAGRLRGARHDVLDCNQFPYVHIPPARMRAALGGHALAVTWHEVWGGYWHEYAPFPAGLVGMALEEMVPHLAAANIAVSRHTARRLQEAGVPARRISMVPDAIELDRIRAAPPRGAPVDLVYVGRLIAHKRVDRLLAAVAKVRRQLPEVRCTIVGTGPEEARLRALSRGLGLEDHVTFTGDVRGDAAIYGLMKRSRVFVSPSEREGFGIAPLEAMACGLPVVTVDAPLNAVAEEFLVDGRNGLLVREASCRALAAALVDLLSDEPRRRAMAREATATAAAYDAPQVARQLEAVYLNLADRQAAGEGGEPGLPLPPAAPRMAPGPGTPSRRPRAPVVRAPEAEPENAPSRASPR